MSTYSRMTKNPITGVFEKALWMDDHFGHHHYGVKFPDGSIIDPDVMKLETREQTAEERLPEVQEQLNAAYDTIRDLQGQVRERDSTLNEIKMTATGLVALGERLLARRIT
jgi:hypothetical protein